MPDSLCIWCKATPANSLEHILPEALGCPPEFVLTKGVCIDCNNNTLSKLDRALLRPFELMTVVRGIKRKRGKALTIDGFSSLASINDSSGPKLFINREKFPVETPGGKKLGPTSKRDEISDVQITEVGSGKAQITISQQLRFNRKSVRGLFKIALESIAYFQGTETTLDTSFDCIRDFVIRDHGDFGAILLPGEPYDGHFGNPFGKDGRPIVVPMAILQIAFVCDFDPEFSSGNELIEAAREMGVGAFQLPN